MIRRTVISVPGALGRGEGRSSVPSSSPAESPGKSRAAMTSRAAASCLWRYPRCVGPVPRRPRSRTGRDGSDPMVPRLNLPAPAARSEKSGSKLRPQPPPIFVAGRPATFFPDEAEHFPFAIVEARRGGRLERAGPGQVDGQAFLDAPRPRRHDTDRVREEERLLDVVGDEEDGLMLPLPDREQELLHH